MWSGIVSHCVLIRMNDESSRQAFFSRKISDPKPFLLMGEAYEAGVVLNSHHGGSPEHN